jgi:hypothetical protein
MDPEVTRELKKIEISLAAIQARLATIDGNKAAAAGSDFPSMPFPAFDQPATPLPI